MKYLLALAILLATASSQQTAKPEVVQLRDEPGRNPYQQTVVSDVCELAGLDCPLRPATPFQEIL